MKCLEEPLKYGGEVHCWGSNGTLLYQISEYTTSHCNKNQYDFGRETLIDSTEYIEKVNMWQK